MAARRANVNKCVQLAKKSTATRQAVCCVQEAAVAADVFCYYSQATNPLLQVKVPK